MVKKNSLKLLNDFQNKQGIYKFESITKGIGILLYGPPGTGKTSFITVLSAVTGRHIINVNLTSIRKNHDLLNIFYSTASQTNFHHIMFLKIRKL